MSRNLSRENLLPPLWVLSLLAAGLAVWLLIELKEIVVLLVVGYSIAYVVDPCLDWFERRRIPRTAGILVILTGLVITLGVLALTALPTIGREYEKLAADFPAYIETAREKLGPLEENLRKRLPGRLFPAGENQSQLDLIPSISADTLNRIVDTVIDALLQGYSLTLALINLLLLPFIVYYLAVDFNRLHASLLMFFPVLQRERVRKLALEIDHYVSAFVRGQLLVCCVLFVLYALALRLTGLDLWLLLAAISGFGAIVPYLGFLSGIFLSSLVALVTAGSFSAVLKVWAIYAVIQILEGTLITPWIVGKKVGLSPLTVILAIFAGGTLFGLLGVFLAVPGAAVTKVLMAHVGEWFHGRN